MRAFLEDAGAGGVDDDAAEELARILENYIGYISEEAIALAQEDDRGTVTRDDIIHAEQ